MGKADDPAQLDSASAEYAPLATYGLAVCSSAAPGRGWSRQDSNVKPLAQDGAFSGTRILSTERQATKPRKRSLSRAEPKESSSLQQRVIPPTAAINAPISSKNASKNPAVVAVLRALLRHRPAQATRRHKTGDNQIHRARVLEVRIHLPPAGSLLRTSGGCRRDLCWNVAVAKAENRLADGRSETY
jgi:hypothetical protein